MSKHTPTLRKAAANAAGGAGSAELEHIEPLGGAFDPTRIGRFQSNIDIDDRNRKQNHNLVNGLFSSESSFNEFLKTILDYAVCALQVVDREGRIVYINESFKEVHDVAWDDVVGRPVTEIIDNTRMHIVARTGIPEYDHIQNIKGIPYVVSRIPIVENGECIGAVGLIRFRYLDEVKNLTEDIKRLQRQIHNMHKGDILSDNTEYSFNDIVSISGPMRHAKILAMQAAETDATVLLRGESGVGKEVFAHSIHNFSRRRAGPFVRVNCSAIHENLIESELFGYEEGAFTGARKGGHRGKFEQADCGTIFLDEIGDMPLAAQVKLLRVIQEREVDRLGSEKRCPVDVRIIAATNSKLEDMVRDGGFREDLYYRLNVIPITIPALRQIPEDIPWVAKNLWEKLCRRHGIFHKRLAPSAFMAMQRQPWKGNVRELQNVLERTMIMSRSNTIEEADVRRVLLQGGTCDDLIDLDDEEKGMTLEILVERTEKRAIRYALAVAEGNRSAAAKLLGISRPLFYKKLSRHALG